MRASQAARFLWMAPLAVMLLLAGLLWHAPVGDQMWRLIVSACSFAFLSAMASFCFYKGEFKTGFVFSLLSSPGVLILLAIAFGWSERPSLFDFPAGSVASIAMMIAITIATMVGGAYLSYWSNYLPIVFLFGVFIFPVGLFVLVLQLRALTGW